jgi:hypothetical protein
MGYGNRFLAALDADAWTVIIKEFDSRLFESTSHSAQSNRPSLNRAVEIFHPSDGAWRDLRSRSEVILAPSEQGAGGAYVPSC